MRCCVVRIGASYDSSARYYDLAWEEKDGVTSYAGKFGCSDDECTVCKHVLADTALNACKEAANDGDGSFKLMAVRQRRHH